MAEEHRNTETATSARRTSHKRVRERQQSTEELTSITWGHFDAAFETYNQSGPEELHVFLKRLDGLASWASTRQSILSPLYEPYRKKQKGHGAVSRYEILPNILAAYDHPREDIIQLASEDDLYQCLDRDFGQPLFYRASQAKSTINAKHIRIESFWDIYRGTPDKRVSVYDYAKSKPDDRTYQMAVMDLLSRFEGYRGNSTALNLLDIKNELGEYCPAPIRYRNATECLFRRKSAISRNTNYTKSTHREFFLWGEAGAMSTIHVDTGGYLTWIMVMGGRKIWYFARGFTPDDLNWLALSGSQTPEGYPRAGRGLRFRKETCCKFWHCSLQRWLTKRSVMPPGCPHAVFTPDDCLAVGGQFYTTAHLASTLRILRDQERYPGICNEDLKLDTYKELSSIIDDLRHSGSRDERYMALRGIGDWHNAEDDVPQGVARQKSIQCARATFLWKLNELDEANGELYE